MNKYDNMSDQQKKIILQKEYENNLKSFKDIAKEFGTYANKIRRDAVRLKINIRNKSDAQKIVLKTGKTKHPTKGKNRTQQEKDKIGKSVMNSWSSMSDKELEHRKQIAREQWNNMSDDKKEYMLKLANNAVREASKKGSKLEIFLFNRLLDDGFKAEFHKEQNLVNTKLQIDIFLPKLGVAIEVDGPSHFAPVWGEESLKRNQKYDNKKTGLILGKGLTLIRIVQNKDFSKAYGNHIYDRLLEYLENLDKIKSRQIIIGE